MTLSRVSEGNPIGTDGHFDYDWIVIGSGFGGSVSALRLAEKGYRVAVLECGARFEDNDFAEQTSDVKRYYWMPYLGLKGILRLTLFKDIFIGSGCGVGGGSLGYANTLYRPLPGFYTNPQWSALADWERELAPYYDTAERMLGVTDYDAEGPADLLLKEYGHAVGVGDSVPADPRRRVPRRAGHDRPGPLLRRRGAGADGVHQVRLVHGRLPPRRQEHAAQELPVVRGACRGRDPAGAHGDRRGASQRRRRARRLLGDLGPIRGVGASRAAETLRARGVVVAAGALGTNRLLQRCKLSGSLPKVSDRLGYLVRTNSESNMAVTAPS